MCYILRMKQTTPTPLATARERRLEMQHLQAIEGNPLTADEIEMFDMFEREGWSHERCLAHVLQLAKSAATPEAAE